MLLIDAAVPISQVDRQLASRNPSAIYKPCVIVLNKWDLAQDNLHPGQQFRRAYLDGALKGDFGSRPSLLSALKQR